MSENIDKNIGGQAVIEGVMMRAPGQLAIAVRKQDGGIAVKKKKINLDHKNILKKPFIRGIMGLYDALVLGIYALNFSAQQSGLEEDKPMTKRDTAVSLMLGLGGGILLFIFLPLWITNFSKQFLPVVDSSFLMFNAVDGLIRVIFFVAYLYIISLMKDIRRVFEYHGAEHKSIYAYEKGFELTVDNARNMSRFHPRCGTSFLLIVMLVAIVIFSLVPKDSPFIIKFGSRIVLMPVIAGISYEILRLSGKYSQNLLVRFLITPGLWLQKLTTREPDDTQLEVAIVSIKAALAEGNIELDKVTYV